MVFSPGKLLPPMRPVQSAVYADGSIKVHFTGLDHGGKEDRVRYAASGDGRAAQISKCADVSTAIEAIDMIAFERRVRGIIQSVLCGYEGHRTRLLIVG